jgi:hypothetical protein
MDVMNQLSAAVTSIIQLKKGMNGGKLTQEHIREAVDIALQMAPGTDPGLRNKLIEQAEFNNKTWMDSANTIFSEDKNWSEWLTKAKPDIQWRYWDRYASHLRQEGWAPSVLDKLDETVDETLGQLTNPLQEGAWDRRGMVVGSVQSGKTANYTGLVCKAADAGYKVIIVLAGFHNNLRSQTQIRLEEGFLGYDKSEPGNPKIIGVGEHAHDAKNLWPDSATTRAEKGDFGASEAKNFANSIDRPLLFVVKKNKSVLENLIKYLIGQAIAQKGHLVAEKDPQISGIPLLLIDDESDQGSINTNKTNLKKTDSDDDEYDEETDPTKINGLIRTILNTFEQSAYVAYTATPFANIMIHKDAGSKKFGDDLFPKSFITCLEAPSNYIGPQKMFGYSDAETGTETDGLPLTREISDYADSLELDEKKGWMPPKHKSSHRPLHEGHSQVPPSLYEALLAYVLACGARFLRDQGKKHSSMLVHVTRFTDVQHQVYEQVNNAYAQIKQELKHAAADQSSTVWSDIKRLWESDFLKTTNQVNACLTENDTLCATHDWQELAEVLPKVVQTIKVREINGTAKDVLDYEIHKNSGLNVIAIGGDKLSRGLTLEGLLVSYFTRPSKTYDTLMQMGRWFGYRNGFVDLTRLYAPEVLINWFRHISDADAELRNDFKVMCAVGATPETFGHRVLTHPLLQVTSPVKMRDGQKEKCSYSGDLVQTIVFDSSHQVREQNLRAVTSLIADAQHHGTPDLKRANYSPLWTGLSSKPVLNFLESYRSGTDGSAKRVDTTLLAKYIDAQNTRGNLTDWTILISGKSPDTADPDSLLELGGHLIGLRKRGDKSEGKSYFRTGVITDPKDEYLIPLDEHRYKKALLEKRRLVANSKGKEEAEKVDKPGGIQLRKYRSSKKGLLIIYPIDAKSHKGTNEPTPYFGFAISFPVIDGNQDIPVEYIVNSVGQ